MAEIDVLIEVESWANLANVETHVIIAANAVFTFVSPKKEHEPSLCVLLADDATLRRLNHQFRRQDKPTNVLSFPSAMQENGALGDIAIAYETCQREAQEEGKTLGDHLTHLVIHGTLHLLGYDHETDEEAETMEMLERQILAKLGIADPYRGENAQDGETLK